MPPACMALAQPIPNPNFADLPNPPAYDENRVARMQAIDKQTALDVVCMAGMPSHDALGNVLSNVWANSLSLTSEKDRLIDMNDIRKLLLTQLNKHIEKTQDMILEMDEHESLVQWVTQFTLTWETRYKIERNEQFDIGQQIFSSMQECVFQVTMWLRDNPDNDLADAMSLLRMKIEDHHRDDNNLCFATPEHTLVRFLFRVDAFNTALCRFAARLLQRRQGVRAGVQSSTKQLNTFNQQQEFAKRECLDILMDENIVSKFRQLVKNNDAACQVMFSDLAKLAHKKRLRELFKRCTACNRLCRRDDAVCGTCSNGLAD